MVRRLTDVNVTIVGLGLIGGSIAMALKNKVKNLWAVDVDEAALRTAERWEIINQGYVDAKVPLKESDLVILSIYPNAVLSFIEKNNDYFKNGAVITDTAGIKACLTKEIEKILRSDLEYIGGHPMAGRESQGLSFADRYVFAGATYIFTPSERNSLEAVSFLEKFAAEIGCDQVVKMSPEEHDRTIALTSQLPHLIAVSLVNGLKGEEVSKLIGGSFKDATRVALINGTLWQELLIKNRHNVLLELKAFEERLDVIREVILKEDAESLIKILESANQKRGDI